MFIRCHARAILPQCVHPGRVPRRTSAHNRAHFRILPGAAGILAVLIFFGAGRAAAQTLLSNITPQPRCAYVRMEYSAVFEPRSGHHVYLDPAAPAHEAASLLNAGLRAKRKDTLEVTLWTPADTMSAGVFLGTSGSFLNSLLARIPDQRVSVTPSYPGPEGYVLDVMPMFVIVEGSDAAGLRYGVSTLLQLLYPSQQWWGLQACRVVDAPEYPVRWFYHPTNIQVAKNVTDAKALWSRASALRLNGVHLSDSKFARPTTLPRFYLDSLTSLVRFAGGLGMRIVPGVMGFGYSNDMLYHDPNYAAGLPVRRQRFVIAGDSARLVPHRTVSPSNGGFEQRNGNQFPGFAFIDKPGTMSFADTQVVHSGRVSVRFENFAVADPLNGNARMSFWTRVAPFTEYHVSAWVRTENFSPAGGPTISVLDSKGRSYAFNEFGVPGTTSGWTKIECTFNSLETDTLGVYWGVWGARSGKIWWDDLVVEETNFVNLLRRPGAPLAVENIRTRTPCAEGSDFSALRDPLLGSVPYNGVYTRFHTPPALRVPAGSALHAGDSIDVSYYHTVVIYSDQVMMAVSEPGLYSIIEREFRMLDSLIHPDTWFMMHDEIRVLGWDATDEARGMTCGQLLADNVRTCYDIIRRANPRAEVWDWSDMFDEYHNAVAKNYYLVKDDLRGSADLLPKDLGIVNWNSQAAKVDNSLAFFAQRGLRQLTAPYYDSDIAQIRTWKEHMRSVPGVTGMMYTTWAQDYSRLDAFAAYSWNHAPYIFHQPPTALTTGVPMPLMLEIAGDAMDAGWSLSDARVMYRTSAGAAFTATPFTGTPGTLQTVDLSLPAGTTWLQWYITATDNRGFTTHVPFGDTVYYQLGSVATAVHQPVDAEECELRGLAPNPTDADGMCMAEWSAPAGHTVRIEVFDMLGREIFSTARVSQGVSAREPIDLGDVPGGVYLLRLTDGIQMRSARIIRP